MLNALDLVRAIDKVVSEEFTSALSNFYGAGLMKILEVDEDFVKGLKARYTFPIPEIKKTLDPIPSDTLYYTNMLNSQEYLNNNTMKTIEVELTNFSYNLTFDINMLMRMVGEVTNYEPAKKLPQNIKNYILYNIQSASTTYKQTIIKMVADVITTGVANLGAGITYNVGPLYTFTGINNNFSSSTVDPIQELLKMRDQLVADNQILPRYKKVIAIFGREAFNKFWNNANVKDRIKYFEMSAYDRELEINKVDYKPFVYRGRLENIDIFQATGEAVLIGQGGLNDILDPDKLYMVCIIPSNIMILKHLKPEVSINKSSQVILNWFENKDIIIDRITSEYNPHLLKYVLRCSLGIITKFSRAIGNINIT